MSFLNYRNYWRLGFQTRFYDLLTPQAYFDSLQRVADLLPAKENGVILDAGCGSGHLLMCLENRLKNGERYLGVDRLLEGLTSVKYKSRSLGSRQKAWCIQSDIAGEFPIRENSIDNAAAHFSIYTLGDGAERINAIKSLYKVLKPGGTLVAANPSIDYDSGNIIKASLESLAEKSGALDYFVKKWILYPLTQNLGLKFIARQLKSKKWHAYSLGELCEEVKAGGFSIEHTESVYGNSGYLVVAKKS